MTDRHLDEGIIQAYIDGELSREHTAVTAAHLAACEACSAALAAAEDESSFFAVAFAPDESVGVPTAALRARLNAAVAQLEASTESEQQHSQRRSFGGFLAALSGAFTFTPRAAAAFATLLLAVAAGIIYFSSQRSQQTPDKQGDEGRVALVIGVGEYENVPAKKSDDAGELMKALSAVTATFGEMTDSPTPIATPEQVGNKRPFVAVKHTPRANRRQPAGSSPNVVKEETLPGEKAYQTAIASLEKTIKFGGDQSLRPTVRAEYERNLALVDSAIEQTRHVAAQNPKDKDAVSFLMSAYQNKVELLTRVADQAQVAALGR